MVEAVQTYERDGEQHAQQRSKTGDLADDAEGAYNHDGCDKGAHQGGDDDDGDRRPEAELLAQVDEQGQFDDRQRQ